MTNSIVPSNFVRFDSEGLELVVDTTNRVSVDKSAWKKTGLSFREWDCLSEFFPTPSDLLSLMINNMASHIFVDCETGQIGILNSVEFNADRTVYITLANNYYSIDEINCTIDLPSYTESLRDELHLVREEIAKSHQPNVSPVKPLSRPEFIFESQLEAFLEVNEISVERQVRSMGKIIDLWIPNQIIIEVKSGKVSGNDACQAIDYLITFGVDVLLIGTGMSKAATRAIEAINKVSSIGNRILFVTKESAFGYLKGVCK